MARMKLVFLASLVTAVSLAASAASAFGTAPYFQQGPPLSFGTKFGFGAGVALSADGNTALVGKRGEEHNAVVFTRTGTNWTQQGEPLVVGASNGQFGNRVAL